MCGREATHTVHTLQIGNKNTNNNFPYFTTDAMILYVISRAYKW